MKNIYCVLIVCLFIPNLINGQTVFPIGAKWYYSERFPFSGDQRYMTMESTGDTTIREKSCIVIEKSKIQACSNRLFKEFFHINDSSEVFFFDTDLNIFQKLYDFNADVGEQWTILLTVRGEEEIVDSVTYTVDSISQITINEETLKVFHTNLHYHQWYYGSMSNSKYIENIGDVRYFFPWNLGFCDSNYFSGLRCYEDDEIGFYSTGLVDSCNYEKDWVGVISEPAPRKVKIFPNPASDFLNIQVRDSKFVRYKIFNVQGKIVLSGEVYNESTQLALPKLHDGIYIIEIQNETGLLKREKIIKQKAN